MSWTHYKHLIRVSNDKAREYYAEEAIKGGWSVRELERQIATQLYERLLSTHRDSAEMPTLLKLNPQYKLIMPTEDELKREIEITRENFHLLNP